MEVMLMIKYFYRYKFFIYDIIYKLKSDIIFISTWYIKLSSVCLSFEFQTSIHIISKEVML